MEKKNAPKTTPLDSEKEKTEWKQKLEELYKKISDEYRNVLKRLK